MRRPASSKLGALLIAVAAFAAAALPASANSSDSHEVSLRSQLAELEAAVKQGSERLAAAIEDASEQAAAALEAWTSRAAARFEAWREALSGRKDTLATFGRELDASLDEWKEAADQTWYRLHSATREALDRFNAWLHGLPAPSHDDQFPV